MAELFDRVVMITGGTRGIGLAVAQKLANPQTAVIITYSKPDSPDVALAVESLKGSCAVLETQCWSAADSKAAELNIEGVVSRFNRLDVLVNNAGVTKDNLSLRLSDEDWYKVLDINLFGAFACSRVAAKAMLKKKQGRIINITSVVAFTGNPGQANYVSSKAGLVGLTKTLALELASRGITVNAVAPGFIGTEMTEVLSDEAKQKLLSRIPAGTLGKPSDVAEAVDFLASDRASYITGQTIHVNGGLFM